MRLAALAALAACASAHGLARAEFPSKPLRIVVPYSAGGGADLLARLVGRELSERIGQPVIVENRGGASNTIGMALVAAAARDGYTLGLATPVFVTATVLSAAPAYDAIADFAPVAMIGNTPLVLVAHPGVNATTTRELVALARTKPGSLNYASLGPATTQGLAASMFGAMAGIDAVAIAYRGSAPGVADLIAGNVQFMFNALPSMLPHIEAGKLRALGTTGARRAPQLPGVPAIAEVVPGYRVVTWYALVAPAGTPEAVVERLNRELAAILADPRVQARLRAQGLEPEPMTRAALAAFLGAESARWKQVGKTHTDARR